MQKDRKKQQRNIGYAGIAAIVCLVLGMLFAAAYALEWQNSFMLFIAKCQYYLLGKGAFRLPFTFFVLAWELFWDGKIHLFNKKTIAVLLVMLCLLGTAHHIFIAAGEELTPSTLPDGGGLAGGLIALALHRAAGVTGTYLVLAVLWVAALFLLLPLKAVHAKVKTLLFGRRNDAEQDEVKTTAARAEAKPARTAQQPAAPEPARKPDAPAAAGGALKKIYANDEFGAFTDGIKKESTFKRILNFGEDSIYEQEPVKQEVEQDPVQIPEWETERKPVVVLRPVVNYDDVPVKMPAHGFLDGTAPDPEPVREKEIPAAKDAAPRPIIYNEYRDAEQSERRERIIAQVEAANEERSIEIFDSADKVQGAEKIPAAADEPEEKAAADAAAQGTELGAYRLPPLEILDVPHLHDPATYQKDIMEQCAVLEQTLADFRVKAKVIAVTRGPSVTRYELEPAPGVKVSSVVNLADDIALRLAAPGVRIEAPIPGKSAIGIEAPNTKNDTVCFREVVDADCVRSASSRLCIGLGKDISGNIIPADLAKMPHLLVAGSTGSGKSVCINTIIAGILYKARPDEVKLILVDPKVVELSNYNGIPHLLTPVVTEPKKAASALHWAVAEMERRYKMFADSHVREINSYNAQAEEKMPFIVIIIDELSDLMMVAKVDVEDAILRLAQKARAAGIHLILATQRPSVDVITGIVKANIPSRIAFAVSSQTDSRTIIDMGGAEKLLGKGDMLFYPIGYNKPVRVQGAFVTDAELNKITDFIIKQSIPVDYKEEVTQQDLECDSKSSAPAETGAAAPAEDELFEDALELVLDMGQASSSMLQRRFRIGYTRAARLVDTMEELGIVGQSVGSKPREVIISRQEAEERFLSHE